MKSLLGKIDHQLLGIGSILLILAGLLFSRAMMSIGMIALLVNAVINRDIAANLRRFGRNSASLGLTGLFLLYFLSGWNSENMDWWMDRLRIKLPFLILPFAMVSIPQFKEKIYYRLLYLFFWLITLMCLYSLVLYLVDFEDITYLYREGKVMATPVMHIRFSLMAAYCVAIGWYFFQERVQLWHPAEHYWVVGAVIFMAVYLHILAVRSGLLALYGVVFYFLLVHMIRRRRYWSGLMTALLIGGAAFLASRFIPTLKNKIYYTRYGIRLFQEKQDLYELSDSYRLGSIEAGLEIGKHHFWTGVGAGDVRAGCDEYFLAHYPSLVGLELMPHNQYIFVFAATGILGLLYFIWATFYPLFQNRAWRNQLFVAFHLIVFLSFMVEHTIETQLGTAFYILFLLLGIRFLDEKSREQPANPTA
jgi:O-antigen ligase